MNEEYRKSEKVALILLGGWGLSASSAGNAISHANPKSFNSIWSKYPHQVLSGSSDSGTSSCISNYSLLSAGKELLSPFDQINSEISSGEFYNNKILKEVFKNCKQHSGALHLVGDIDSNNVNSSIMHIVALLNMAKKEDAHRVYLHLICDNDERNLEGVLELFDLIEKSKIGEIATLIGSDFVRSDNFKIADASKAISAMVDGHGEYAIDPRQAVAHAKNKNVSGKKLLPVVMVNNRYPITKIMEFDSVIFFNFSPNSLDKFADLFVSGFPHKIKSKAPYALKIATFTDYSIGNNEEYCAFKSEGLEKNLVELVSRGNRRQIHIMESASSENLTNLLSGREKPLENEKWEIVPSNDNSLISSTKIISEKIVDAIKADKYELIIAEYASAMNMINKASISKIALAIHQIDNMLDDLVQVAVKNNVKMIITSATNGLESLGAPGSKLSRFPAVFISNQGDEIENKSNDNLDLISMLKPKNSFLDIAPTVLDLLGLEKSSKMTGRSLANNFGG